MTRAGLAKGLALSLLVSVVVLWGTSPAAWADDDPSELTVELPAVVLTDVPFDATVKLPAGLELPETVAYRVADAGSDVVVHHGQGTVSTRGEDGAPLTELTLPGLLLSKTGERSLSVTLGERRAETQTRVVLAVLSILPPFLAIVLALLLRQVVLALFAGVWLGTFFLSGFDFLGSLLTTTDTYAVGAVADTDHAFILIFSLLLGGMVGVITRSGGGAGLAELVTRRASDSRKGQLATWVMGLVIFFDDYANSLLVGSSMRPISDRLRVSREKLAFLVDATSAPVASIAIVSSWIGVEVGYIADQYAHLGIEGDAFWVFLETIPYRFYPLLMLWMGLVLVVTRRDFGPMLRAEMRARETGAVIAEGATPASEFSEDLFKGQKPNSVLAILPILTVICVAIGAMYIGGRAALAEGDEPSLRNIFGNANSYEALLWASLLGSGVAVTATIAAKALSINQTIDAWLQGLRAMLLACVILVLAWSLGKVCKELQTAQYVIQALGPWLSPGLLPAVVFLVAALVSFATGTSWGTMAILFPLVVPMAHEVGGGEHHVMLGAISSILAGSVWGDHCSPISDTTIMSSMAASCDHVDHVKTQLPYALSVGVISVLVGELGTGFGLYPPPVGLALGAALITAMVVFLGKKVPDYRPTEAPGEAPPAEDGGAQAS